MSRVLKTLVIISLLLGGFLSHAQDSKRKELENRRFELQQEIKRINALRTSNLKKQKSVLTQVEDLDTQISTTERLIKVTNQQANLLTRNINNNIKKIEKFRDELVSLKEDYDKMIVKSYKSRSNQNRIMFLLSSKNFLQAYKRVQYMKQYTEYRKEQGEQIQERTKMLQTLNADLIEQRKDKDKLIKENKVVQAQLRKDKEAQEVLVAQIRKKEGQFTAEIRKKQQEINRIDNEIDRIIREAIAKSNKGAAKEDVDRGRFKATPESKALASKFEQNKGKLPWPVKNGVVSMRFGTQPHPIVKSTTISSNGVRIDTEDKGRARAVFGGKVSEIQAVKGANKVVMVRHGDYITIYSNLSSVSVRKGDDVDINQDLGEIGKSTATGKTTLYFIIYKNTQKLNPASWVFKM